MPRSWGHTKVADTHDDANSYFPPWVVPPPFPLPVYKNNDFPRATASREFNRSRPSRFSENKQRHNFRNERENKMLFLIERCRDMLH